MNRLITGTYMPVWLAALDNENVQHLDPVDSMQLVLNPKFALLKTEIRMLVFILKENFEKVVKNLLPFQKQLHFSYQFLTISFWNKL